MIAVVSEQSEGDVSEQAGRTAKVMIDSLINDSSGFDGGICHRT